MVAIPFRKDWKSIRVFLLSNSGAQELLNYRQFLWNRKKTVFFASLAHLRNSITHTWTRNNSNKRLSNLISIKSSVVSSLPVKSTTATERFLSVLAHVYLHFIRTENKLNFNKSLYLFSSLCFCLTTSRTQNTLYKYTQNIWARQASLEGSSSSSSSRKELKQQQHRTTSTNNQQQQIIGGGIEKRTSNQ